MPTATIESPPAPSASTRPYLPNRLISIEDVASLAHVSINTVRLWIAKEEIPQPARIGRGLRWNPAVIDQWLSERGV